jgi:hypothetical protein
MKTHPAFAPPEYIRIDALPEAQRKDFADWLWGHTCPVIPSELDATGKPAACAYRWDYEHWLVSVRRGEVATPLD